MIPPCNQQFLSPANPGQREGHQHCEALAPEPAMEVAESFSQLGVLGSMFS